MGALVLGDGHWPVGLRQSRSPSGSPTPEPCRVVSSDPRNRSSPITGVSLAKQKMGEERATARGSPVSREKAEGKRLSRICFLEQQVNEIASYLRAIGAFGLKSERPY